MTITLKEQIKADLKISDENFSRNASDLLIVEQNGEVMNWLQKHYKFARQCTYFRGIGPWQGKLCVTVPFAAWNEFEAAKKILYAEGK